MAAERIGVLDRVCVNYRQRRAGAITRTRGDRHFEVFPQWHRVFRLMDAWRRRWTTLRPAVFERMIWHYLTVLGNGERIAPELRPRLLRADHRRLRALAAGRRLPGRRRAWRGSSTGSSRPAGGVPSARCGPPAGPATRPAAGAHRRRRVGPVARRSARLTRDGLLREYYRAELRRPSTRTLAVYAAYWYRGYACNPAAIYEAARRLAPRVRGVWIVRRDRVDAVPAGVEYVVAGTPAYYRVLARARWLVNNVNFPDFVRKRPDQVHVQTHHGTPVKVMGLDQQRYPIGAGGDGLRRAAAPGGPLGLQHQREQLLHPDVGPGVPGHVHHAGGGLPAQRPAGHRRSATRYAGCAPEFGIAPDEQVVLYAPTHREHLPGYRPRSTRTGSLDALG